MERASFWELLEPGLSQAAWDKYGMEARRPSEEVMAVLKRCIEAEMWESLNRIYLKNLIGKSIEKLVEYVDRMYEYNIEHPRCMDCRRRVGRELLGLCINCATKRGCG